MATPLRSERTGAKDPVVAAVMDFPDAMRQVIDGKKVTRKAWGNEDCIFLHVERLHLRKGGDGSMHQLLVSAGDMEATDWVVVREQ